jgi:hypothetical protein
MNPAPPVMMNLGLDAVVFFVIEKFAGPPPEGDAGRLAGD